MKSRISFPYFQSLNRAGGTFSLVFAVWAFGSTGNACVSAFETIPAQLSSSTYSTRFTEDETLAAKIRSSQSKNPFWMDMPMSELKPFVRRMRLELERADRRMTLAGTPWIIRKLVMARVQHLKASVIASQLLPTYRMTMDLGFRFAGTISVVEWARGFNEHSEPPGDNILQTAFDRVVDLILNRSALARGMFKSLVHLTQATDTVLLPTFAALSESDMNRFWSRGIFPIGFSGRSVRYDFRRGSLQYTIHDLEHARQYFQRQLPIYVYLTGPGAWSIHKPKDYLQRIQKFKLEHEASETVELGIFAELDRYDEDDQLPHPQLKVKRRAVEQALFELRHEGSELPAVDQDAFIHFYHDRAASLDVAAAPDSARRLAIVNRADAILWLADKYRSLGAVVPEFTREDLTQGLPRPRPKSPSDN